MTNSTMKYLCLAIAIITLTSCGTKFKSSINELMFIKKGMSTSEFKNIIPNGVEYKVLKVEVRDKKYKAYSIPFETALGSGDAGSTRTTYHYMSKYYMVFHKDKLIYWGYMYELMRAEDPLFHEIGRYLQTNYNKVY